MSIGQIAEIATMAALGFFLKRLGWRTTMIIGVLGHVVRFGIYALGGYYGGHLWLVLVVLSNVVHGFAYAFFFATVYIFVDENFPEGRPHKRSEPVQPADPGVGAICRRVPLEGPGEGVLDKGGGDDYHGLHGSFLVPFALGCSRRHSCGLSSTPQPKEPVPEEVPVLVN